MKRKMFESIDNSPDMPSGAGATEHALGAAAIGNGVSAIENMILTIVRSYEGDHVPKDAMLEWIEVGENTCMRIQMVDGAAYSTGYSRILAVAVVLMDIFYSDDSYVNVIAQDLRLSMRLMDGRIPSSAMTDMGF
jgi:hypothetical protein